MKPRLFLGFDFGTQKIGVAIGQELTRSARPLAILHVLPQHRIPWDEINRMVSEWGPDGFVVGIPLGFDAANEMLLTAVRAFCHGLKERYALPVFEVDELLSTRAAHAQIDENLHSKKRKHHHEIDDIAAQVILEAWLSR